MTTYKPVYTGKTCAFCPADAVVLLPGAQMAHYHYVCADHADRMGYTEGGDGKVGEL